MPQRGKKTTEVCLPSLLKVSSVHRRGRLATGLDRSKLVHPVWLDSVWKGM